MYKLALVSISTVAGARLVPLLAHFRLVIFMCRFPCIQLVVAMSVGTIMIKLTGSIFHPVSTKFCFVIEPEVFDVFYHFFSAGEIHVLFRPRLEFVRAAVLCSFLALHALYLLHQRVVWRSI